MSFKSRLKSIERKLCLDFDGIDERKLLSPNYKFKGTPFNSTDEMIVALKVIELSPYYSYDQIIQFYLNGLLGFESEEMQEVRIKYNGEMQGMM